MPGGMHVQKYQPANHAVCPAIYSLHLFADFGAENHPLADNKIFHTTQYSTCQEWCVKKQLASTARRFLGFAIQ